MALTAAIWDLYICCVTLRMCQTTCKVTSLISHSVVLFCAPNISLLKYNYEGSPKRYRTFFYFLLYLRLNQTCLIQSTPLYCWYTAPSVFSSSWTRPGTCFAGWREGPVANFLLSPLRSEIGDLLGWTSTLGTGKIRRGQVWSVGGLGHENRLLLRQKFTDKKRRVGRCIVMVQHPGLVCQSLRPLPSHCFPQTLHDLQVKLFIDCLTTWNKLMMNNTLPIKKKAIITFTFEWHWLAFFGRGEDFPTHCDDCTFVSTS